MIQKPFLSSSFRCLFLRNVMVGSLSGGLGSPRRGGVQSNGAAGALIMSAPPSYTCRTSRSYWTTAPPTRTHKHHQHNHKDD